MGEVEGTNECWEADWLLLPLWRRRWVICPERRFQVGEEWCFRWGGGLPNLTGGLQGAKWGKQVASCTETSQGQLSW